LCDPTPRSPRSHHPPPVARYKQAQYSRIQAFFNRTFLFPEVQAANAVIAEKAEGEVSFVSVFDKAKTQKTTAPKFRDRPAVVDVKLEKGREYEVAPAKGVKPVPAYSRFARLAGALATAANLAFRPTPANPS